MLSPPCSPNSFDFLARSRISDLYCGSTFSVQRTSITGNVVVLDPLPLLSFLHRVVGLLPRLRLRAESTSATRLAPSPLGQPRHAPRYGLGDTSAAAAAMATHWKRTCTVLLLFLTSSAPYILTALLASDAVNVFVVAFPAEAPARLAAAARHWRRCAAHHRPLAHIWKLLA